MLTCGWVNDYFSARRALVDSRLAEVASRMVAPGAIRPAIERAMTLPGKRVRAVLVMAVGEAEGTPAAKLVDAAAAIEMIHASSLILDDLPSMDDAEMRRGAPTLHREFGEDIAILTAVALLNHAYGLVSQNHAALTPRRWPANVVMQRVVDAVGWDGTVAGEAVDLHSDAASLDFETLEYIHSRKTGALFVAAAAIGGMLANTHPATLQRIEVYAKNLGLAFQITDDVLDVTASAAQLGKDVGKDEARLTFVKLAGVDGARKLSDELVETSLHALEGMPATARPLRELAVMVRDRTK